MLTIDGAYGEGGGQIVRSTLTLAAILTQPVRIEKELDLALLEIGRSFVDAVIVEAGGAGRVRFEFDLE